MTIRSTPPQYPAVGERWYLAAPPDERQGDPWLSVLVTEVTKPYHTDWAPTGVTYRQWREDDHLLGELSIDVRTLAMATFAFIAKFTPEVPEWQKATATELLARSVEFEDTVTINVGSRWRGDPRNVDVIVKQTFGDGSVISVTAADGITELATPSYPRADFLELFTLVDETVTVPILVEVGSTWYPSHSGLVDQRPVEVIGINPHVVTYQYPDAADENDVQQLSHAAFARNFQLAPPSTGHGFEQPRVDATPYTPGTSTKRVPRELHWSERSIIRDTSVAAAETMLHRALNGDVDSAMQLLDLLSKGLDRVAEISRRRHAGVGRQVFASDPMRDAVLRWEELARDTLEVNGNKHVIRDPETNEWQTAVETIKGDELNRINQMIDQLELQRSRLGYADPSALEVGRLRLTIEYGSTKYGFVIEDPNEVSPRSFGQVCENTFAQAVFHVGTNEAPMPKQVD